MTITKADLINKVYTAYPKLTRVQAYETVETILKTIKDSLENRFEN